MQIVANKLAIAGVGVDIIELDRFRSLRFPERIAELVLTGEEYTRYETHANALSYLASRFALKEAVIKACPGELSYHDIEIVKEGKKPRVKFLPPHENRSRMFVSLSHSTDYVAGFAVSA